MPSLAKSHGLPGWLILIAAMTAVGPVSIDMYLPAFPLIEHELGEQGVEQTMSSYLIGIALGQLFYGPISDRFGRKPPLYFGFLLYAIGALGCALADSMTVLVLMRVLQALGACSSMVIGRAIVRDRCQPEEAARAFSILMMIISLGPIIAPVLGGWIVTALGWRSVFVFQALMGLSLLAAMHMMLTESRDPAHVIPLRIREVARGYGRLLVHRKFVAYSLIGGFGMGALFCFVAGSPTVMIHLYELSPQQFGWLIALNGLAFLSASRINMLALRRRGPSELLARAVWLPLGTGLLLCGLALFMHLPLALVILLQFTFFIGVASINPNVAALALAPHGREAGSASAMMGAIQSTLATVAGVAVGAFNDNSLFTLVLLMTIGAAGAGLSYWWATRRTPLTVDG